MRKCLRAAAEREGRETTEDGGREIVGDDRKRREWRLVEVEGGVPWRRSRLIDLLYFEEICVGSPPIGGNRLSSSGRGDRS
ncbi:hypothetical protein QYF36_000059 [Acer negundo]|nr:hypothetical protein QYF36_000059 [Acer negundo]